MIRDPRIRSKDERAERAESGPEARRHHRPLLVPLATALACALGLWTAGPAMAQDAEPPLLTLDQAVSIAIAGSPSLAAESAAARAAEQSVRESHAARWPTVEVTTDATRTTNPVMVFGQLLSQERFSQANFDVDFLNQPDALNNVRGAVSISQPLWAGGRIAAGIRGAEQQSAAASAGRERALQQLVYRVTDRYTGAVVAAQAVKVREESLEVAKKSVKLTQDLFDGGLVVESDLLQAKVRESEGESALADARQSAEIARSALNLELGRALDTPFGLPEELAVPEGVDTPLADLVARARDRRPDLAAARAQVAAARAGVDGAEGGRLPKVGWSGAYEANADDSLHSPGTNWTVGVGLRWTLFNGYATGARIARSRARLDEAERRAELAERGVALEVESALSSLHTARLRWQEAVRSVDLAERSATIVHDRYKEGLTTVVELLQADALATGSRVRELRARRDLAVARAGLALAVGDAPAAAPVSTPMAEEGSAP